MKYLNLHLLALWRAASPSTGRPARHAFKAPAAFLDEIREDQLSRASSQEVEADDEDEATLFDLPAGWDNDATDAAFVQGAALLRGEVGIDELTEVTALPEHPAARVELARPVPPAPTGLLGLVGTAVAGFQPHFAVALSAVAIVGGAIALAHHRHTTEQHPGFAKAEPEHWTAPEQAVPAPRSQERRVASAQQSATLDPPATYKSAAVPVPEAATATALQRAPVPSTAPVAVAALPMQRQEAAMSRQEAPSQTVAPVPPVQVPDEGATVLAASERAPVEARLVASSASAPFGSRIDLPMPPGVVTGGANASAHTATGDLVVAVTGGTADPVRQAARAADPLAVVFPRDASCDTSDVACLDAVLARSAKARAQLASLEQRLTIARAELAAAKAVRAQSNDQVLAAFRFRSPDCGNECIRFVWTKVALAQDPLFFGYGVTASERTFMSKALIANASLVAPPTSEAFSQVWLSGTWNNEFSFVNAFTAPAGDDRTLPFQLLLKGTADTKFRGMMATPGTPGVFSACSVSLGAASAPMCGGKWTKEATLDGALDAATHTESIPIEKVKG